MFLIQRFFFIIIIVIVVIVFLVFATTLGNKSRDMYAYSCPEFIVPIPFIMQSLVTILVALVLASTCQAQVQCYTEGNVGSLLNLVSTVKVVFSGTVVSTYTANELAAAFAVRFSSGRPLLVQSVSINENNVTLALRKTASDLEAQTGATLVVNFTALADVPRNLTVNGTVLSSSGRLCTTVDRVSPVIVALHAQGDTGPNMAVFFSEPVQKCGGGNLLVSALSTTGITTGATELTAQGSAPSTVWYFSATGISGDPAATASITAGGACDASGNAVLATTAVVTGFSDGRRFASGQSGSFKYYDLNADGRVDAMLLVGAFAFNDTLYPLSPVPVQVDGVDVAGVARVTEDFATDNSVLFTFDDTTTGTVTSIATTPTALFGPSLTCLSGLARTAVDVAPPIILSVTGPLGSKQITVTVSEAHSTTLSSSQFEVYSPYGLSIVGSTGTPTTTNITLVLSDNIRSTDAFSDLGSSQVRVYLKLQAYGDATFQGFPLWRSVSPTSSTITRSVITRAGTGAWDTLTLTLANGFSASDLSTSSLRIVDTSAIQYTVTTAVALSSTQARFTVSQVCVNASEPCIDTSPTILYNVTIGNQSATLLATEIETVAPVFVGVSAAVGSNQVRVRFSEPVVGWSPSTLFSGLSIVSIADGPLADKEKILTLARSIRASDLSKEWLETELVDALGNEAIAVPLIFAVTATAHDDDGDGLVTRIRLTTTLQHQAFTSSAAFATIPVMTLGAVTRVSATVSDIAVTAHNVAWGSSLSMQYTGHASVSAKVLLSADLRGGLELPLTTFAVESSTETTGGGSSSFSDLSTTSQALIISGIVGAALVGILAGSWWKSSASSSSSSSKRRSKRFKHELLQENDDNDVEMM